jgi:hypothetical protein
MHLTFAFLFSLSSILKSSQYPISTDTLAALDNDSFESINTKFSAPPFFKTGKIWRIFKSLASYFRSKDSKNIISEQVMAYKRQKPWRLDG